MQIKQIRSEPSMKGFQISSISLWRIAFLLSCVSRQWVMNIWLQLCHC